MSILTSNTRNPSTYSSTLTLHFKIFRFRTFKVALFKVKTPSCHLVSFCTFFLVLQGLDTSNLVCLYALHERYLNNLLQRFDEGLIDDFYRYKNEEFSFSYFGVCIVVTYRPMNGRT